MSRREEVSVCQRLGIGCSWLALLAALLTADASRCAQLSSSQLPQTTVGATSQATAISINLPGIFSTPQVRLHYGTEFTATSTSCIPSTAGTTCSVSLTFTPRYPGLRQDALLVQDGLGNVLATDLVSGQAIGSQLAFFPATAVSRSLSWSQPVANPAGIAVDQTGVVYVADTVRAVVLRFDPVAGTATVAAGTGSAGFTGDGGLATNARFSAPTGLALDGAGNLYIADQGNNRVRRVDAVSSLVTTVAGGGTNAGSDGIGDGGAAISASLSGPEGLAVDIAGNLYVCDSYHGLVRKVSATTGIITVIAGGGTNPGIDGVGDGGPANEAQLASPSGITLDDHGSLYIADSGHAIVREVAGGVIVAVAGNGVYGYSGDGGSATTAQLMNPKAVVADPGGDLLILDSGSNCVRLVTPGGTISTVALNGVALNGPEGLGRDSSGSLYIADTGDAVVYQAAASNGVISFASQALNTTSSARTLTILNEGTAPETILSNGVSFSNFTLVGSTCPGTIPGGGTCTVNLQFTPTRAGQRTATLTITGSAQHSIGIDGLAAPTSGTVANPGAYDDSDPRVSFSGSWASNTDFGRYLGTQTFSNTAGNSAVLSFVGTQIIYLYEKQQNLGHAQISIDGTIVMPDLDEYSAVPQYQQKWVYSGLSNSAHTVVVSVLGTRSAGATDAYIIVDAFVVGARLPGLYDDSDPGILYAGTWGSNTDVGRYDGTQSFSHLAGSTATFTFNGTQVTYVYEAQANLGHARISIDGAVVMADLDEYAPTLVPQKRITFSNLTNAEHTISITALGTQDVTATGSYIIVDAIVVGPRSSGSYDDSDPGIVYAGSWGSNSDVGRYQGTQTFSNVFGCSASFTFTGSQVTYLYETQANLGHAEVAIDGVIVTPDLDEYSPILVAQKRMVYSGLSTASHTITVTALGRHSAAASDSYIIVDAFLVGPQTPGLYDDSDPDIVYTGNWGSNSDIGRYNGTQTFTHFAGNTAALTFTGTQVAYIYEAQPNLGYAQVSIDGLIVSPSIDEYSASLVAQKRQVYSGLSNTTHTITVTALGTHNPAASDSYVIVDAFVVGPRPSGVYDDSDPGIVYAGGWMSNTDTGRFKGTQSFSAHQGDAASFTFAGTQVSYVFEMQQNLGHAQISIDGTVMCASLDQYSPFLLPQQKVTFSGLSNTAHTITVTALGTQDTQATGSYIVIDAFVVGP